MLKNYRDIDVKKYTVSKKRHVPEHIVRPLWLQDSVNNPFSQADLNTHEKDTVFEYTDKED